MIPSLLMIALLTVTDPVGGPAGAATLTAPTSAMYRNLAPFDIREIAVLDEEQLELRLEMGAWSNPLGLENGFSHPIIEIYIGGGEHGSSELLPGSGLVLPDGETWTVALQLTGDHARGWFVDETGVAEFTPSLQLLDDHLYVMTEQPRIEAPRLAALSGLYSPFHQTGWRPLETAESPWAFSSEEQQFPVVDVLALNQEAQAAALAGGVLPVTEVNLIENPNTVWFALMAAGIAVAGVGLIMRGIGGRPVAAEYADDEEATEADPEKLAAERTAARLAAVMAADSEEESRRLAAETAGAEDDAGVDVVEAAEPEEDPMAEAEPEDDRPAEAAPVTDAVFEEEEDDDIEPPRIGLFRGQTVDGDNEPALPDFAAVDFGDFEDEDGNRVTPPAVPLNPKVDDADDPAAEEERRRKEETDDGSDY